MKQEDYIRLGFTPLPHYTVAGNLIYNLGRNRQLSAGCVGTPNEMIFLCQMDNKDPMITTDLVCVHNWDYDKEMTEEKLTMLIKALSGGVGSSTESGGENGVLYDVSNSTDLKEIFFKKVKSIAETYHDRLCMSCLSMDNQVCKCCGSVVHYTTSIEHDSQDYSKDLNVCSNCYSHIATWWKNNRPRKTAPI